MYIYLVAKLNILAVTAIGGSHSHLHKKLLVHEDVQKVAICISYASERENFKQNFCLILKIAKCIESLSAIKNRTPDFSI